MQNRPELNGKNATVVGFDDERGRYHGDIDGVGRASLQPANLILPKGARGKVVGLTSDAGSKWNDQVRILGARSLALSLQASARLKPQPHPHRSIWQVGKVLSFDREAGRYVVEMSREDQLRIKPANLIF